MSVCTPRPSIDRYTTLRDTAAPAENWVAHTAVGVKYMLERYHKNDGMVQAARGDHLRRRHEFLAA